MKRILGSIIAIVMLVGVFTVGAAAITIIDTVSSAATLVEAVTKANDGTIIQLANDITLTEDVVFNLTNDYDHVIDGDGHKINMAGFAFRTNLPNVEITFKNITLDNPQDTAHGSGAMQFQSQYITLNMENVTITNAGAYGVLVGDYGKVNISGGSISHKEGAAWPFSIALKSATIDLDAVTLDPENPTTFTNTIAEIRNPDSNVNYVMSEEALAKYAEKSSGMRAPATIVGEISLSEALTINGASGAGILVPNGSSLTVEKDGNLTATSATVTIENGGKLIVEEDGLLTATDATVTVADNGILMVNGGEVVGVDTDKISTAVAQIGDDLYAGLGDAVAAARETETIILLADTTENIVIPADKTITITSLADATTAPTLKATSGHTITNQGTLIIDAEFAKFQNETNSGAIIYNDGGTVTIDNGTFGESEASATSYYMFINSGTMTINDGEFYSGCTSAITFIRNEDEMTINGGAFSCESNYLLENELSGTIAITAGSFTALDNYDVIFQNYGADDAILVSGGDFSQSFNEDWVKDGYTLKENESDGRYYVTQNTTTPPVLHLYATTVETSENGAASVSSANNRKNAIVIVTATPDAGYEVGSVVVAYDSGLEVDVTDNGDGTYSFKQPDSAVTVTVTFVLENSNWPFVDVETSDWYFNAVKYVYENGLMNGVTDTYFTANVPTTRGMIATLMYRMAGSPDFAGDMSFSDVASGSYYETPIAWAQENGIVTGYSDTTFSPEENISREQLAAILYRYAKFIEKDVSVGENTNILSYNDAFDVAEYAIPAVQWMCGAGLMEGTSDGYLVPQGLASRAEVAAILMRFLENE